jgi:hypothetical protein
MNAPKMPRLPRVIRLTNDVLTRAEFGAAELRGRRQMARDTLVKLRAIWPDTRTAPLALELWLHEEGG